MACCKQWKAKYRQSQCGFSFNNATSENCCRYSKHPCGKPARSNKPSKILKKKLKNCPLMLTIKSCYKFLVLFINNIKFMMHFLTYLESLVHCASECALHSNRHVIISFATVTLQKLLFIIARSISGSVTFSWSL